tara:strand:- start:106 stop:450 length:345 start_codon:yes stop_codon:yes gene_type:complete
MANRYDKRRILFNDDEMYEKFMQNRHMSGIRQYATGMLKYPTAEEMKELTRVRYIWKAGDRFYKLSVAHYGTPKYWWLIALFNKTPTEADLKVGALIYIPLPLAAALRMFGQEG